MAHRCRSRTIESPQFNRTDWTVDNLRRISGRLAPQPFVVHSHPGRVPIAVDVAVKYYDRHSAFINLFYDRRDCLGLVGGSDDDVKIIVLEIPYVGNLPGVVVVGRAYLDHGIFMEHHLAVDFFIHFHTPVITAALRHADAVGGITFPTSGKNDGGDNYE